MRGRFRPNPAIAREFSERHLQATPFVQGLAHVQLEPALWAWIDATGKVVFRYEWKQEF